MSATFRVGRLIYTSVYRWALSPVLRFEARKPTRGINERPVELAFVFRWLASLSPRTVLDVGSGTSVLPRAMADCGFSVTAIDDVGDYWSRPVFNRHYLVQHDDITHSRLEGQFDLVTCISTLEHIRDHERAMRGIFDHLAPHGHLILSCPYSERWYCPDVYRLPGRVCRLPAGHICQVYSRQELDRWLNVCGAEIVDQEFYEIFAGPHWGSGERLRPSRRADREGKHELTCVVLRRRRSS